MRLEDKSWVQLDRFEDLRPFKSTRDIEHLA